MHISACGAVLVKRAAQKIAFAIEPALRLEKREKQEARGVQEGDFAPRSIRRGPSRRGREVEHHPLELTIEAPGQGIAPEQLAPTVMHKDVGPVGGGHHRRECLRVGVDNAERVHREGCDPSASPGRRHGDHECVRRRMRGDDDPQELR